MAQVRVQGHLGNDGALLSSPQDQQYKISQYEKIERFQDAVLSGNHPSIKIPPNLIASAISSIHQLDASNKSSTQSTKVQSTTTIPQHSSTVATGAGSSTGMGRSQGFKNTEINPILLEKSDELVKAELQLQRQRLERALREDVEQRRSVAKNGNQSEALADFDLSDVLSKALTLVQATAASTTDSSNLPTIMTTNDTTNDNDAASDSFDDNTFYSSQHHTPSSVLTSRVYNESEERQAPPILDLDTPSNLPQDAPSRVEPVETGKLDEDVGAPQSHPGQVVSNPKLNGSDTLGTEQAVRVPGLNAHIPKAVQSASDYSTGAEQSHRGGYGSAGVGRQAEAYGSHSHQPLREQYVDMHPPSPLMRPSERRPVDPRSGPASPLTSSRRLPPTAEATSISSTGTPAQVAALRNEPINVTSPESSPQGSKSLDKRKGKKKKRKADRQALEVEASPYIKPEPRSPSPIMSSTYLRPNKRQRYNQIQPGELPYAQTAGYPQVNEVPHELQPVHTERDDRIPVEYGRPAVYPQRAVSTTIPGGDTVYRREYVDERYAPGSSYVMEHPSSVPAYHQAYPSTGRSSSHSRPADGYHHPSPYPNPYEAPTVISRREGDGFMVPPRPQPTRIIVDAYGREYIEPPRPSVVRHSVAPHARFGEPEIVYERVAPRAVSRHTGVEPYEEGGAVYRRSSPTYMPRRVVTQPEYVSQEYRDGRPRENSSRPLVPQGEYVEYMAPPERRLVEEGSREFMARGASQRPAETVRYQVARDYGRVQSVRPEASVRQYGTSVHPESRREAGQPYTREYGTLAAEPGMVRREYSVRPVDQYYDTTMRGGEVAFVEGPRAGHQEVVYADEARREIYR